LTEELALVNQSINQFDHQSIVIILQPFKYKFVINVFGKFTILKMYVY